MRSTTCTALTTVAAALVALSTLTACGGAQPSGGSHTAASTLSSASTPASGTPQWCPTLDTHRVDCGTIDRDLVPGSPDLGTVQVAYALIHRTDQDTPAAGTILPNPGGPGVPLIEHADLALAAVDGDLLTDHDLLLIDPRGTGRSTPLDCGVPDQDFLTLSRDEQRRTATRCGELLGPRAAGYTSAATVDDFDAVRNELGIPKVVLYGISYGTYLLPVYAQRHPDHVQSMVLSGAYPHDFDTLNRPNAEAVSLALQRICDRSGVCDGAAAVADLRAVNARLRTDPLPVPGERPFTLTEDKFASLLFEAATSGVGSDPDPVLGTVPAALRAAVRGDDAPLRAFAVRAATAPVMENIDLYLAVACNDYPTIWSPDAPVAEREQQYRRAVAAAEEAGAFSAAGFSAAQRDGGDICLGWPATTRIDHAAQPLPDVPVLVLSGDLDAITPDANGVRVAAKFPRATFVSVPNVGHVPDLVPGGCVSGLVTTFLRTGTPGATDCVRSIAPIPVTPVTD
ncbi:alpha/beta fold hydrolase [Nocardia otitidiscaviarum]|uniref:alpha/beta fold hydrolase n=1 Tax=Nocardia otitidiscaviarum TaxID=1823 RepID=UPI001893AB06|nr:alpha/beta hydrolase [Nocardia otitidiscaviarum]MBF6177151.1 alpha/beta fold hydrolase [Nocardia otitidiscaviarum]